MVINGKSFFYVLVLFRGKLYNILRRILDENEVSWENVNENRTYIKSDSCLGGKGNNPHRVTGSCAWINFSFTLHLSVGRQIRARGGRGAASHHQSKNVLSYFPFIVSTNLCRRTFFRLIFYQKLSEWSFLFLVGFCFFGWVFVSVFYI